VQYSTPMHSHTVFVTFNSHLPTSMEKSQMLRSTGW
jgi:hypothetical protein